MKQDQTICHKVDEGEQMIQHAIKSMEFDAVGLSRLLYQIRSDAQRMESALKLRKKMMVEAGIEEKYQEAKGKVKPSGINKIANADEEKKIERETFEVTITREGEVVYQHKAYAGAVSLVEEIQDIDSQGVITGITQKLTFGHPLGYWFAFNQLDHAVRAKNIEIMTAIGAMMKNGKMDRDARDLVMKALGKMNIKAGRG